MERFDRGARVPERTEPRRRGAIRTVTNRVNTKVIDRSTAVEITTSAPNGDDCEPICHGGRVIFTS
jgi:hypothetical protein